MVRRRIVSPVLGLVLHRYRDEVREMARRAVKWCGDDIEPRLPAEDAELIDRPDLAVPEDEFADGLDACLSLGGDGTMLRSSAMVTTAGVPILGVNGGNLGYLTEVDPEHMIEALDDWRDGRLRIEERMLVEVTSDLPGGDGATLVGYGLNEAVVYRSESAQTLEVQTSIGGEAFTNYLADGVIVATPTGSTAYSLSAGGPIVEPDFHALLLTPVAAHMVFNRSMVLAPTTEIRLTVEGYRAGVLSIDGRPVLDLDPGASIVCRGAEITAKLLVRGDRDFHTILKEKFRLVDE